LLFKFGHCVLELPFWGLGSTYTIDLRLIGKRVVVFLVVLIELFRSLLWLRANIEKEQSHGFFATAKRLTLVTLTVFTQRNFVADFLQAKCDFTRKTAVLRFLAPPLGRRLATTYDVYLRFIGKREWTFY